MSVTTSFTRRSLAKNRMRTMVSIVGIALSVALITAIWMTVSSLQQGLYARTVATEGWWQLFVQRATDDTLDALAESGNVTDAAVSYDEGVAFFTAEERETLGSGIIVKSLPAAVKGSAVKDGETITRLPKLTEGELPDAPGEVILPDRLKGVVLGEGEGAGAVSDGALQTGSWLTLQLARYVSADDEFAGLQSTDDAVMQINNGGLVYDAQGNVVQGYGGVRADLVDASQITAGGSFDDGAGSADASSSTGGDTGASVGAASPVQLAGVGERTVEVVGFYDDSGPKFFGNDFTCSSTGAAFAIAASIEPTSSAAASLAKPETGNYAEVWASTAGFSRVNDVAAFADSLPQNEEGLAVFTHHTLMRYQGISSDSLMQDSLTIIAGILAVVVAVASVSLIYNSFSISVAERTRQFGLLASLGASKRQLRRSVLVEACMLGAIGIPCGVLLGTGGTAAVLALTGQGLSAMLGIDQGVALDVEPGAIAVSAALSIVTLLVSAWAPARRASRVSAIDAIRQTQDVRASKRARRKAERARVRAQREAQPRQAGRGEAPAALHAETFAGSPASSASVAPTVQSDPFAKKTAGGLWGLLAGVPGVIAHRNLSRQSARGRIVVASLAVSVVLVVTAGAVAQTMDPFASRVYSMPGAVPGADVAVSTSSSDSAASDLYQKSESLEALQQRVSSLEGASLMGSVRQGTTEVRIPADMLTDQGRWAIEDAFAQRADGWVPHPVGVDGSFYGQANVFYLDDAAFDQLAQAAGAGDIDFADPSHPRAIALNSYQGVSSDAEYVQAAPFAQTGRIEAYFGASIPNGYSSMGVVEGADGQPALGLLDQASVLDGASEPVIKEVPANEALRSTVIDVVALATEVPDAANAMAPSYTLPALFMHEDLAGVVPAGAEDAENVSEEMTGEGSVEPAVGKAPSGAEAEGSASSDYLSANTPFTYSWATISLQADDHAAVAEAIQAMLDDYPDLTVNVSDLEVQAQSTRLAAQTIQVFILCFTVIMALIAVANVFNTLTNSIILRTHEFAVLKSVGMGERSFARMLVCECASYALRGLLAGLALAILVAWGLYQALGVAFAGVSFALPWAYIGAAVALVLVVLAVSVIFALRRSHAANVVEALRADAV